MADPAIDRAELTSLKDGVQSALKTTRGLLESHLKHLIHILLQNRPGLSTDSLTLLKKSAEEINRSLASLQYLNGDAPEVVNDKPVLLDSTGGICIKSVIKEIVTTLKSEHYLDHIILVESLPSDLPPVKVDPIDLEEIFYNVTINAAQAMLDGGKLIIDASYKRKPVSSVVISFQDSGNGIPKEAMPHIFEPSYNDFDMDGLAGFGLFTVKKLVERNHGDLIIQSRIHYGTTVIITFPVEQTSEIV